MGGCQCAKWWERRGGPEADTCDAERRGGSVHLRVETVLDAPQKLRGSSGVSIPGTGERLPFDLSGWKYMFKIMTPHREDLFIVFLLSFPLGNRCAVAPVCAPSSERKGGRKGGSLGSAGSASGRFLAAGAGAGSGTAVTVSASLQASALIRGNICLARRKYRLLPFSCFECEVGAWGKADFKRGLKPLGGQ